MHYIKNTAFSLLQFVMSVIRDLPSTITTTDIVYSIPQMASEINGHHGLAGERNHANTTFLAPVAAVVWAQKLIIFLFFSLLVLCITSTTAMVASQQLQNDASEHRIKKIETLLQNLNETLFKNPAMLSALLSNADIQNTINAKFLEGLQNTYQFAVYTLGAVEETFDALDKLRNAFIMLVNLLQKQANNVRRSSSNNNDDDNHDTNTHPMNETDEFSMILQSLLASADVKPQRAWHTSISNMFSSPQNKSLVFH